MRKVLVVDDEERTLRSIRAFLTHSGYEVVTAKSGEEGLTQVLRHAPDVVVLDLVMQGMTGYEFLESLRSHSTTPVIATSTGSGFEVEAFRSGANAVLRKPFSKEALSREIDALLREDRSLPKEQADPTSAQDATRPD